ncbi:uncharacterized protein CC84DRAFT_278192 [Paraphaeosphaeria sporulosa]|uniref:Protein kinase domain-containing protein n=1 Tax=Paraphaeosphaeria sporulosa TaxID=1460663 RepID=A0A177C2R7_9PLEO|nr:uncharacterized protein CC84DRAFT_278192 [Paraphaeosphaeria sporulosa]OAG01189.1 hypothetical protein CC84DRAFT_278192 [Paraphaeosphaeria sporulosa]
MASQGGNNSNFDFNAGAGIDFTGFGMQPAFNDLKSTGEGNTSSAFFFGDEGIDTTATFDHSYDSIFAPVGGMDTTAFGLEPLGLGNTAGDASWNNMFPTTPAQSFESLYTPQINKRPLQLDAHDFPPAKRHEAFSPFTTGSMTGSSNWALETQPTPAASSDVTGLSDEAADVCATWFSKYNVLPSDRHIDSLAQLTGESAAAIRQWFGQALKQGMTGQDSAYKSQTGFAQDPILFPQLAPTTGAVASQQLMIPDVPCVHETQAATTTVSQSPLRGGKKGCNPTEDPELLKRDPNKIYQCTRKCGKRYGRKCDWKRNEEEGYPSKSWLCSLCVSEGVERVKPCFRKYHFSQHFRNIHPGLNSADYEESSVVHSDTSLPQAARKCGFCTHRFVSRQDRIDHIADHFKNGKSMLDWNEEDTNDSDDMNDDDDNDDRPDSGGFGNGKPHFPPEHDPRGSGSGPKNNGSGGNGSQPHQSGFFQFQVSQLADGDSSGSSPGVEQHIQRDSTNNQHIQPAFGLDGAMCSKIPQGAMCDTATTQHATSTDECSVHGRHDKATRDDSQSVAGDVVSLLSTDVVQLQTRPPFVPPSDGDPAPDRLKTTMAVSSGSLTRETQDLLGSLKLLGAGGFSTVDEVVHRETSLRFARKTLKNRERSAIEELKNEVDVLKKLRHPHIIRFVDSVQKGDRMSILLSPVAETTLAAWLDMKLQNRPDRLSETIVTMMGCLASSIRYLHAQRPVVKHMDIKPQNILVKQGEDVPHVFLSDFGVSSMGEITASSKTMPLTRQYCAPEVSEGVSRELASDVWSLGCVFLEMLTVAYKEDNPRWLDFRQLFGGRKGKYYWQDVPALQGLLTQSLEQAASRTEANATSTVKEMLNSDPTARPTAPKLTMVFTPAPCCLSWPNEKVAYPGPSEELQTVKTFCQEDGRDACAHLRDVDDQHKQQGDTVRHAKRWLEECSHDHADCRHDVQGILANKTLPTRLIDMLPEGNVGLSVRIVNGADLDDRQSPDYAALSYVWADDELKLSTARLDAMQRNLPREALPKAINEAITKAQDIGLRYLWVDNLCVLQDSQGDKQRESRAMADVYRNAALTIVATQKGIDQQALQAAVLPLSTYLTPGFAWDTRAWSLQERLLSRRFLHLGEEQMYWECNALKASETFPRGLDSFRNALSSLLWEKVHTRADALYGVPATAGLNHNRMHTESHFDMEGTGTAAGLVTERNANGHGAPTASKAMGYGKTATPHQRVEFSSNPVCNANGQDVANANKAMGYCKMATPHQGVEEFSSHLVRDCQYVRKEGDGIGDSMEAGQMQLQLAGLEAPSGSLSVSACGFAGLMRGCHEAKDPGRKGRENGVGNGNGIEDEGVFGKNPNARRKYEGDEDVMS